MKQKQNNNLKKEAVSSPFRGRWPQAAGGLLILLISVLLTLQTTAQELRWERIKPISAQTELLTPDTADILLVEDATDGLRKSLKIKNLPVSQAAQDSLEALEVYISTNQQAIIDSSASLQGQIDLIESSSHPLLTKTGTGTYVNLNEANQVLTVDQINLTTDVTGLLTDGNIASASTWNDAYTHSLLTIGNPHQLAINDLTDGDNVALLNVGAGQNVFLHDNFLGGYELKRNSTTGASGMTFSNLSSSLGSIDFRSDNRMVIAVGGIGSLNDNQMIVALDGELYNNVNWKTGNAALALKTYWHSGNLNLFDGSEDLDVNSIETTLDGNSAQWNDAYSHSLIDNDIDNTDELQDTTNIPFLLEFVQNNSIDSYTETDQIYAADSNYIKSHVRDETIHFTQGEISISANHVTDFDTEVANNSVVLANTGKDTTGIYHANRSDLDLVEGINTGDETLLRLQSLVFNDFHNLGGTDLVDDADNNPNNELQTISKVGSTVTLSDGGGSFTDAVDDADNVIGNEYQDLSDSKVGENVTVSITNGTDATFSVADNDNDPTNELQDISGIATNASDIDVLQASSHPLLTKTGTGTYVSLNESNQVLTVDKINLTTDVTGLLTDGNIASAGAWNAKQDLITGNESVFDGWDKNVADDFSGDYGDLSYKPDIVVRNEILTNEDLNSIMDNGTFYYSPGSNSVTNKPSGVDAFGMISFRSAGGYTTQLLSSTNQNKGFYYQSGATLTGDWKKLIDEDNINSFLPTVNNPTITFQRNGVSIGNLTLNQSSNETFNFIDENTQISDSEIGVFGYIKDGNTNWDNTYGFITTTEANALYEQIFSKNTAFNKNFGTTAGTVAQGNDSRFHNAVTIGNANGLSLSTQQLSLGLASSSSTGALSATDWNTFNNKSNLVLGELNTTAYRGDRGKIAYDYSQIGHLPLSGGTITSMSNDVLDIAAGATDQRLIRLSHPTNPTAAAGYLGFADNGESVVLGVQYSFDYYDAIKIDRETRDVTLLSDLYVNGGNSIQWNDSYIHSQTTNGNPHQLGIADLTDGSNVALLNVGTGQNVFLHDNFLGGYELKRNNATGASGMTFSNLSSSLGSIDFRSDNRMVIAVGGIGSLNDNQMIVALDGELYNNANWKTGNAALALKTYWHSGNLNLFNGSEDLDVNSIETTFDGNSTNWNDAYSNKITSASVTGTTTRSITLTQQDSGTISAELFWTGTQAEYDALGSYDSNKIYFIED